MQDMDAVYRQHFRMVYQYLMSLTHQPDVAEELAQEKLTLDNDTFENTGKSRFFERRTSRVLY
mgnify:FL=1